MKTVENQPKAILVCPYCKGQMHGTVRRSETVIPDGRIMYRAEATCEGGDFYTIRIGFTPEEARDKIINRYGRPGGQNDGG